MPHAVIKASKFCLSPPAGKIAAPEAKGAKISVFDYGSAGTVQRLKEKISVVSTQAVSLFCANICKFDEFSLFTVRLRSEKYIFVFGY